MRQHPAHNFLLESLELTIIKFDITQALGLSSNYLLMPTIHHESGFQFRIYQNDHEPAHVHAIKDDGEVKIQILGSPKSICLHNMKSKDASKALNIVKQQQAKFIERWKEIHGCN